MKRTIFILLVGCLEFLPSYSQTTTFSKRYDIAPSFGEFSLCVEALNERKQYAFTTNAYCNEAWICTALTVTDSVGNILYTKRYDGALILGARYIPQDSAFFLWGENVIDSMFHEAVFLMKTTLLGDTIWTKTLPVVPPHRIYNMLELQDKSLLLSLSTGEDSTSILLIRTDSTGADLWSRTYNYQFINHEPFGMVENSDSTVTVGYYGYSKLKLMMNNAYWSGPGLFKIDYLGNVLKDTAYLLTSAFNRTFCWLVKLGEDKLVMVSDRDNFEHDPTLVGYYNANVVCFDTAFNLIWHLAWPYRLSYTIDAIKATHDGGIIGCGISDLKINDDFHYFGLPWLFKVSADGTLLWERFISKNLMHYGELIDVENDYGEGYILSGGLEGPEPKMRSWLLKVDENGCLQPNCDSLLVLVATHIPEQSGESFVIYPNPFSVQLNLQIEEALQLRCAYIRLSNQNGVTVFEQAFNASSPEFWVGQIPQGVYVITLLDKNKNVLASKECIKLN